MQERLRVKHTKKEAKAERECEEGDEVQKDKGQEYSNRKETAGRLGRIAIYALFSSL